MEDFVSFEIAKKLKEKGFMQKVVYYYNEKGKVNVYKSYTIGNIEHSWLDFRTNKNMCESSPWCDAPTISQVLKWLREEKHIHICTDFDKDMNWYYQIAIYGSTDITAEGCGFKSYEDAMIAGIEYVLDDLI